uniref:Uncharacterized protein n=1 Tax=Heliothis virescens TaxID=7102 RepID=A0A2A4J3Z8_HELVI
MKPDAQVCQKSLSSFDDLFYAVLAAADNLPSTDKSGNIAETSSPPLVRSEVSCSSGPPSVSAGALTGANVTAHSRAAVPDCDMVLLGTCQVRAFNTAAGTQCTVRALVDSGAQDCFITTACAKTLGLKLRRCNLTLAGLGQNIVTDVKGVTDCAIRPVHGDAPHFNVKPVVLDNITALIPSVKVPSVVRERCNHLVLADRDYDVPAKIDLLIGAELFHGI